MFAHEGSRCPVKFLELLISKRPQQLRCSGPLYLRPLDSPHIDVWYSSQPAGIHTINSYMKNMAKLGKLDITNKKFTNHSIRKTTVCKLQKAGISNDKIVAVTGHRNEMSLKAYSDVNVDEHRRISNILSHADDQSTRPPLQQYCKSNVGISATSNVMPSTHFSFSNCTVYFDGSNMSQYGCSKPPPAIKKRKVIIDSDSDE